MNSLWLELIIIALLILINGFFACAEFAVISIRKGRVAQLAASGDKRAKIVDALQKNPHKLLAVIQIGVTVVGSTASALGGIIAVEHLRPLLRASSISFISNGADLISVVLVVVFLSYFLLILGELVPKTIGLQRSESVALRVAIPLKIISSITGIFVAFLSFSSRLVLRILGIKEMGQAFISREEIQQMVVEGEESGVFTETEKEYIENIFDFTNMVVREVMVPRTRIVAVNLELSREEILKIILENEYSRYPVFHNTIEEIAGFFHIKDFLRKMVTEPDFDINSIIRPPFYVPEGKKVNDLLREMQQKHVHMALVLDEYGGLSGLVSTEDLLEELVGEIEDEHDSDEPQRIKRLPDGSFLVDALLPINDLEELLGLSFEDDVPFDTLAGLILNQLGRFPERGERLVWNGFVFICEKVTKNALVQVKIVPQ